MYLHFGFGFLSMSRLLSQIDREKTQEGKSRHIINICLALYVMLRTRYIIVVDAILQHFAPRNNSDPVKPREKDLLAVTTY